MTSRERKYHAAQRQRRRGYYCPFPEDFRMGGPILIQRMEGPIPLVGIPGMIAHDSNAINAHLVNYPRSWVDEMALYQAPITPVFNLHDDFSRLMVDMDKRKALQRELPLLMSKEGIDAMTRAVKDILANPNPRTPPPPPPVVEKKPIEIIDRRAEGPGTVLTEDIITLLGFGEYWGESGDFGSRSLTNPTDDNRFIMRIYDIDEMLQGAYAGGYYHPETTPQHFCTTEFKQMDTLGELYEDARLRYPDALPVLIENAKKTMLWYPNE